MAVEKLNAVTRLGGVGLRVAEGKLIGKMRQMRKLGTPVDVTVLRGIGERAALKLPMHQGSGKRRLPETVASASLRPCRSCNSKKN